MGRSGVETYRAAWHSSHLRHYRGEGIIANAGYEDELSEEGRLVFGGVAHRRHAYAADVNEILSKFINHRIRRRRRRKLGKIVKLCDRTPARRRALLQSSKFIGMKAEAGMSRK